MFNITFKSYPAPLINIANGTNITTKDVLLKNVSTYFDNDVFDNRLVESYSPYRFGSFFIVEANNKTKRFQSAVFINTTSQDVTAAYP